MAKSSLAVFGLMLAVAGAIAGPALWDIWAAGQPASAEDIAAVSDPCVKERMAVQLTADQPILNNELAAFVMYCENAALARAQLQALSVPPAAR